MDKEDFCKKVIETPTFSKKTSGTIDLGFLKIGVSKKITTNSLVVHPKYSTGSKVQGYQ